MSCNKITYKSRTKVKKAKKEKNLYFWVSVENGAKKGIKKIQSYYYCNNCNGWHVTTQRPISKSTKAYFAKKQAK